MEIRRFELNQEQIDFLKKEYSENDLVQKILETEKDKVFEVRNYDFPVRILTTFVAPSPASFHFF